MRDGDIISLDCGAIIEGYHGDAAVTVAVGDVPPLTEKLLRVTEESLMAGVGQLVQGNRLHDVGLAVQTVAEGAGFSVVRGYVGHAIGTQMHEEPGVPNYWPGTPGPKLRTGMVFAVEPMVNVGAAETVLLDDGWTVVTADGSLSAHFEHTIAVTDDGPNPDRTCSDPHGTLGERQTALGRVRPLRGYPGKPVPSGDSSACLGSSSAVAKLAARQARPLKGSPGDPIGRGARSCESTPQCQTDLRAL